MRFSCVLFFVSSSLTALNKEFYVMKYDFFYKWGDSADIIGLCYELPESTNVPVLG